MIIAIVALLALGPDKLPGAAKAIGKGIRDLKKQTRDLQTTIERDTPIGDAVRDPKSALRGEDPPPPRPPAVSKPPPTAADDATAAKPSVGDPIAANDEAPASSTPTIEPAADTVPADAPPADEPPDSAHG